jgi:glycosyltransferase involved in cell wall biosynthesis
VDLLEMYFFSNINVLLKRFWRFVYASFIESSRRITPEPVKNIKYKVESWRERNAIIQNQQILRNILKEHQIRNDYRTIIIFPPSLDWNVQLFQRPQQLALALAKQGALVFYIQPKPDHQQQPFQLFCERLYLCPIHVDTFQIISTPLIYLLTWNSRYAFQFISPRILYDYVDDINAFFGDHQKIVMGHQYLLKNANYILATAQKLKNEVQRIRPDVIFSPNGVDFDQFERSARREFPFPPSDMQEILARSNPVIGYYGALAHWFDYDLLKRVASLRPDYQFILIGPDYDGTVELNQIQKISNIHWLGEKPYQELPHYLQYFDVATIPFKINEITHATSPLKLFEYMAGEKPVVITPMQESMNYPGVLVGENSEQFAQKLDLALEMRKDSTYLSLLRRTALDNTWDKRAEEILSAIETGSSA